MQLNLHFFIVKKIRCIQLCFINHQGLESCNRTVKHVWNYYVGKQMSISRQWVFEYNTIFFISKRWNMFSHKEKRVVVALKLFTAPQLSIFAAPSISTPHIQERDERALSKLPNHYRNKNHYRFIKNQRTKIASLSKSSTFGPTVGNVKNLSNFSKALYCCLSLESQINVHQLLVIAHDVKNCYLDFHASPCLKYSYRMSSLNYIQSSLSLTNYNFCCCVGKYMYGFDGKCSGLERFKP